VRNIEQRVNYISELLVGAFYIHARPEQKALKELEGKKVSLSTKGSSATTTGPIVFEAHGGVQPDIAYINNTVALEKMKTGEIAGIASTGGKPNDPFVKLKPEPGFHFFPSTTAQNSPTTPSLPLSHDDCPQVIPEGQAT